MFVHGRLAEDRSDFEYIFHPLESTLLGHFVVRDFAVNLQEGGRKINPIPQLRAEYGSSFYDADLEGQILIIRGDGFSTWAPQYYSGEGAFLPVFREAPSFDLLRRMLWDREFKLSSKTWPTGMRSLLHNWDDMFWQLFSVERADVDLLVRIHSADPKLKMFFVDLDREFPNPSNTGLAPAI